MAGIGGFAIINQHSDVLFNRQLTFWLNVALKAT